MENKILKVSHVALQLETSRILKNVSFELNHGDIACLLGPSGCGKTSLLRIIAGLEERGSGEISLDQKVVQDMKIFTPPAKRKIGMVFQDYALFPHLSVSENITLGLGHLKKKIREEKLQNMLDLVKLAPWKDAYPHKLSGGQQQRVALARALILEPSLLLLDEPFSNLDTELRYQLSEDVRKILKSLNMTAIMVTHDQSEAFSFADKIGVMREGVIEQFSSSFDLYHTPQTPFVASFIGDGVIVPGELIKPYTPSLGHPMKGLILIRPDDLVLDETSPLKARISKKIFRGSHFLYVLDFDNGLQVLSLVQSHHEHAVSELINVRFNIAQIVEFT